MTPWQIWLDAWKGLGSRALASEFLLPSDPLELLSLGLLAGGQVDAATLRQARILAMGNDRLQGLLLLLLTRVRQGHPQSAPQDLLAFLVPLAGVPESGWEFLDLEGFRAAQSATFPLLRQKLSELCDDLSGDPGLFAPLTGPRQRDPLPLLCVESTGGTVRFGFARHDAAVDALIGSLRSRCLASSTAMDPASVSRLVEAVDPKESLHGLQRAAVARALEQRFVVLTGGPGTGKTTVVACLLWALLEADPSLHPEYIALCAPTGRAQARLSESVAANVVRLRGEGVPFSSAQAGLGQVASSTLHSLLGARPDGSFRHHAGHLLPHRVVVVDEASMIDLGMFSALLAAISPTAHLVLVGDKDQLPSVEAGAVLADLMLAPSLGRHRIELTYTWRNRGAIALCSQALQQGKWDTQLAPRLSVEVWAGQESSGEGVVQHLEGPLESMLEHWVDRWRANPGFGRILCITHGGPAGRENVNRLCDGLLRGGSASRAIFLPGQPVILGRNHPERNLWNGDLGIVVVDSGELWADFGSVRAKVSQLDGLESAWAITVHKSQGSEFSEVLFLLPDRDTPLLMRQIAYTALTRAKDAALLWGDVAMLSLAATRQDDRPSRIREA
jgi:exodeoxyribonuclease V alpha subunit